MRLLVTGKTRSGESTALHRILSHALCQKWAGVLLLDGKGSELSAYKGVSGVTYLGPDQVDQWAEGLQILTDKLPARYADPHAHQHRPHPPRVQPRLRDPGEGG